MRVGGFQVQICYAIADWYNFVRDDNRVVLNSALVGSTWGARASGSKKRRLIGVWPSVIRTGESEVEEYAPAFDGDVQRDLSPNLTHFALKSARSIAFSDTLLAPAF